jgi:hypothetical protein
MLVEIRLLARLLRVPLLRVEGFVAVRDLPDGVADGGQDERTVLARGPGRTGTYGRDLAVAEAIMAELGRSSGLTAPR